MLINTFTICPKTHYILTSYKIVKYKTPSQRGYKKRFPKDTLSQMKFTKYKQTLASKHH